MKILGIILAILVLVVLGFMAVRTVDYMNDSKPLGDAIEHAWDDLMNIRLQKSENEFFIGYDRSNIYAMVGCATW